MSGLRRKMYAARSPGGRDISCATARLFPAAKPPLRGEGRRLAQPLHPFSAIAARRVSTESSPDRLSTTTARAEGGVPASIAIDRRQSIASREVR